MITAVIAEDQEMLRETIREQLKAIWPELNVVGEAADGLEALALANLYKPTVIFLDINMPKLTGIEVANSLTINTHVVFITSHEDYALQAFEANAVDYIVKPLEITRLSKVVAKLKTRIAIEGSLTNEPSEHINTNNELSKNQRVKWLKVSVGQKVKIIDVKNVCYFESDTKYTRVVAQDFNGLIRTTIKELEMMLRDDFAMAHRGVLVNRRFIDSIVKRDEQMEIELTNNMGRLKVSLSNQHLFRSM